MKVKSALQKSVRTGNWKEGCYWACELDLNGNGNETWHRLKIITGFHYRYIIIYLYNRLEGRNN